MSKKKKPVKFYDVPTKGPKDKKSELSFVDRAKNFMAGAEHDIKSGKEELDKDFQEVADKAYRDYQNGKISKIRLNATLAGLSAASGGAEYASPEDAADVALMAAPFGIGKLVQKGSKVWKAWRKGAKAEKAAEEAFKARKAPSTGWEKKIRNKNIRQNAKDADEMAVNFDEAVDNASGIKRGTRINSAKGQDAIDANAREYQKELRRERLQRKRLEELEKKRAEQAEIPKTIKKSTGDKLSRMFKTDPDIPKGY